jgi:hypothetical protein
MWQTLLRLQIDKHRSVFNEGRRGQLGGIIGTDNLRFGVQLRQPIE